MDNKQIQKIRKLKGKLTDTQIRAEIRKLGYKKTAANNWFIKIFSNIKINKRQLIDDDNQLELFGADKKVVTGKLLSPCVSITETDVNIVSSHESDTTLPYTPVSFTINGNIGVGESKTSDIRTIEDLIRVCNIDTKIWECIKFVGNSYGENFQAKGEFKRRVSEVTSQIISDLKNDILNHSPTVKKFTNRQSITGKLLVLSVMDAHLGKLSNKEQDAHNYNLKIAKTIYLETVKDLVSKAIKQGEINDIWYIVGNDYLTIDTPASTTTAGTPQSIDSRFSKIFREGRELLIETIDILKTIAPVRVVVMPGNHDRASMFHMGDAIECWYHNDENVTVDNKDSVRKYYTYKKNAIAMTHGDTIKIDKLPSMGLVEYGEEWGKAKRRFWLTGHFHALKVQNIQGTEIWTFPSISGSDEFHQSHGYVGSTRNGLAMIFSEDNLEAVFQSQPVENKDWQ